MGHVMIVAHRNLGRLQVIGVAGGLDGRKVGPGIELRVEKQRDPGQVRRRLLEQLQPPRADRKIQIGDSGAVGLRARQLSRKAEADGIHRLDEDDRNGLRLRQDRICCRRGTGDDHVGREAHQLLGVGSDTAGIGGTEAKVHLQVATFDPVELSEPLPQSVHSCHRHRIVLGPVDQHADPPHAVGIVGSCGECKRRRAAQCGNELSTPHGPPSHNCYWKQS